MRAKSILGMFPFSRTTLALGLCLGALVPIGSVRMHKQLEPSCPTLILRVPKHKVAVRAPIVLSADLTGAEKSLGEERAKLLSFTWLIPDAVIVSGQGTREVLVDMTAQQATTTRVISVDLHVEGFPPECTNTIVRSLTVDSNCVEPARIDQYGEVTFENEKPHLNVLADRLKNMGRDSLAYIVVYAGKTACASEAELRANRAKKYLVEQRMIPEGQIEAVDGGFRDALTVELFLAECSSCGPLPRSTLPMDKVENTGPCFGKFETRP